MIELLLIALTASLMFALMFAFLGWVAWVIFRNI